MSSHSAKEIQEFLREAKRLALEARNIILRYASAGFATTLKPDDTEVTDADKAVEEFLRAELERLFPDFGIIGEEFPRRNEASPYQWIIDPVDGTQNFARAIPSFGSILALHYEDQPLVAVIEHPAVNLSYSAGKGLGTYCNDAQIRLLDLAPELDPRHELIAVSSPANFARTNDLPKLIKLISRHHNIRMYGDCFAHTRAVHGAAGADIGYNGKLWDVAASQLLVEEAGGKFVSLSPKPPRELRAQVSYQILFGKPRVVDYVWDILHGE